MLSLFVTLLTLAVIAIPIVFVVKVARRLRQVTQGLSDPARLQRVFAEHAAAALRRAGADPKAVAKVEMLTQRGTAVDGVAEQRARAYEARIGLQRKGGHAVPGRPAAPAAIEAIRLFEDEPPRARPAAPLQPAPALPAAQHPPFRRPRRRHHPPLAPLGGLDMGDSFRLAEPPEVGEPHTRVALSNWFAVALFAGATAYYFLL